MLLNVLIPLRFASSGYPLYYQLNLNGSFGFSYRTYVARNNPLVHKVDWGRVNSGFYAIADPADPGALLYLSEKEYKLQLRVNLSSDTPLIVIARPGDLKPSSFPDSNPPPNQNTPPTLSTEYLGSKSYSSRHRRRFWWSLRKLGAVGVTEGNLSHIIAHWGNTLWVWGGFPATSAGLGKSFQSSLVILTRIFTTQGAMGLVNYLKVSYVATLKHLAGEPLSSTWELGHTVRLDRSGLPRWLSVEARQAIRSRHKPSIRLWLSVMYSYKALHAQAQPEKCWAMIAGISHEAKVTDESSELLIAFERFLEMEFVPSLGGPFLIPQRVRQRVEAFPERLVRDEPSPRLHAGPNMTPGLLGSGVDAVLLRADTVLWWNVNLLMQFHADTGPAGVPQLEAFSTDDSNRSEVRYMISNWLHGGKSGRSNPPVLSRLHALYEAAGKVRIIGIVDYWTQRSLEPLHDFLMMILKDMNQDGTFNQEGLFDSLRELARSDPSFVGSSLDISAATDNIPCYLYVSLLEKLFSKAGITESQLYAETVIRVLTDRDFLIPNDIGNTRVAPNPSAVGDLGYVWGVEVTLPRSGRRRSSGRTVRYRCGQPMGALASFPLLALVHHAIVQFSAQRACAVEDSLVPSGVNGYRYGVVGDDMVVFDYTHSQLPLTPVADSYLSVCKVFSIPIKLIKSFKGSVDFFSFLSRVYCGDEISPISLKQELAVSSYSARTALMDRINQRWYQSSEMSYPRLLRLSGDHAQFIENNVFNRSNLIEPLSHRVLFTRVISSLLHVQPQDMDRDLILSVLQQFFGLVEVSRTGVNRVITGTYQSSLPEMARGYLLWKVAELLYPKVENLVEGTLKALTSWKASIRHGSPTFEDTRYRVFEPLGDCPPSFTRVWEDNQLIRPSVKWNWTLGSSRDPERDLYEMWSHYGVSCFPHSFLECPTMRSLSHVTSGSSFTYSEVESAVVDGLLILLTCRPATNYARQWLEFHSRETIAYCHSRPSVLDEIIEIFISSYQTLLANSRRRSVSKEP